MIDTFFALGQLDSSKGLFLSLVIGILFGVVLERAGFGSSRRLSGVFYFRDMAVIKVMFTAMITAILGIALCLHLGLITDQALYLNPTVYTAQILGGLLFGIGFVMGGWCPGTAAVGAASGKWDAFVFLGGTIGGSLVFNETYGWVKGLYDAGQAHTAFVYQSLGISKDWFVLLFVLMGVLVFWGMERIEHKKIHDSQYVSSGFLSRFSFVLVVVGFCVFMLVQDPLPGDKSDRAVSLSPSDFIAGSEQDLLTGIDKGLDHMEPEDLAHRVMAGQKDLVLVDVRPASEFVKFHIRTARNIPLKNLVSQLEPYRNQGVIILYSNGMTHPAQARDALARIGFTNVYLLTDGLDGFVSRCLKPVSLRSEPVPEADAAEINRWRQFFLMSDPVAAVQPSGQDITGSGPAGLTLPGVVDAGWLARHQNDPGIRVIDLRSQPDYNTGHIPGALALNVESLRGNILGVPSCLMPANMLAAQLSLMGIEPQTLAVLVYGEKVQDATLAGMAFERLGHKKYALVSGGFASWKAGGYPMDDLLPRLTGTTYPGTDKDEFTVDADMVWDHVKNKTALILDVRPQAYYTGEKSDEARAGHIPGAVNRAFDLDTAKAEDRLVFKPVLELRSAYEKMIPSKASPVIVHCRTGHQASQTFFVLKHLLGYSQVLWYDAGWTQWAARMDLPVKTGLIP